MFHISNVDETKSEWNINETHIIIPMIDGDVINKESDKILTNSLTLNPLESGDQAILNNALEHSFVIGLDKNLFETPNYKSDLVIIQNSDLKLLSCNNDLKNPVAYTLSYVDQDKNEILWQNPQKDRIFVNDKQILEVRDELDYQDPVQELEKNEQINLVIDSDIASQVSKTDDEVLQDEKTQFMNYLTVTQNTESVSNLQYQSSKPNGNYRSVDINKFVECDFKSVNKESQESVRSKLEKFLSNKTETVTKEIETDTSNAVENINHKTEEIQVVINNKNKNTKDEKLDVRETYKGVSDSLPEKSLPLKKKAKMKRTLMTYNCESQRLKQDVTAVSQQVSLKSLAGRKTHQKLKTANSLIKSNQSQNDTQSNSSNDTPIGKVTKRKKATKLKNNCKKSKKFSPDFVVNENTSQKIQEEGLDKVNDFEFDKSKFNSIYDLVECLRKCKIINMSIWQTLNSGLKEMNVDILKEMNAKEKEKLSPKSINYSPQLKAFALVLYFKQPSAFKYLSQIYNTGWPSLEIIKDWKQRINSHQRLVITRAERDTEDLTS